ncbi:hypothetical protein HB904_13270 [Listeria booriae]|uniref:SGNH hydrolase-type esterase domain-containing protein n=1 Tax=Listeria booriae TaxID=1552123 RepID=A0A842AL57_9LIST|nr:leucine-rich repeat domain-containing protein [Listeria booriae]MBC1401003.1 hypothetical protein [Listeria booriae]MBC1617170.1 hypothetical protein [Listeria booriae]
MKKIILRGIVGMMLAMTPIFSLPAFIGQAANVEKEYVIAELFPDPVLAAKIACVLKKEKSDTVTKTQLGKFGSLVIKNQKVKDLTGLENLRNITGLQLTNTDVADVTPLSNLTMLKDVTLTYNKITAISPLRKLVHIKNLQLQGNAIHELSVLSNLPNLANVNLYSNQITNITPLSSLGKVASLDLGLNRIQNIDALASCKNLKSLQLNSNVIEDIAPLQSLPSLTILGLFSNGITDISPVGKLATLTSLDFSRNQVSDVSALKGLKNLNYLKANANHIKNADVMATFSGLTYLNLADNELKEVSALQYLMKLQDLNLAGNQILNLAPLKNLVNLTAFSAINQRVEAPLNTLGEGATFRLKDRNETMPYVSTTSAYYIDRDELFWQEAGSNKLAWQNEKGDFSGQYLQNVRELKSVFLDDFMIGDKYITGVYSNPNIVKMSVQVNQKIYYGGDVINHKIRFYIEGKITKLADKVIVKTYNKNSEVMSSSTVKISEIPKDHAKWDKSNILFMGDSITKGLRANIAYPSIVAKKLRLPTIQNGGISGVSIAPNNRATASILTQLETMNVSTITHVVIFGGTNDFYYNTPLGTEDSVDKKTFYGALNTLALKLKAQNKKMYFITPMWRSRQSANDNKNADSYPNDLGIYLKDYGTAIKNIAHKYNAPYLDLYNEKSMYEHLLPDGIHPNDEGQYFIGGEIATWISDSTKS